MRRPMDHAHCSRPGPCAVVDWFSSLVIARISPVSIKQALQPSIALCLLHSGPCAAAVWRSLLVIA
eukprot:1160181-Pelagomonas_calceolata.AAC.5